MNARRLAAFASGVILVLAGCQAPDVGQPCTFDLPGVIPETASADYLETGVTTDCETLVCMVSPPGPATSKVKSPYCTKPCVSNADCSQSETGLVCRAVVLDPNFINSLDPATREKYLGNNAFSNYCAAPLQ